MKTLKDLRAEAKRLGATIEIQKFSLSTTVSVEAPRGHRWSCDCIHELVDNVYTGPNDYDDLLSRMSYGIEPCFERPNCEWCDEA